MNFCCCYGKSFPTTSLANCIEKNGNIENIVTKKNLKINKKCHKTIFYKIYNCCVQKLWQMFCYKLLIFWLFLFVFDMFLSCRAQTFRKVQLGFPETWNGDKYAKLNCPSKNIPKYIGKNLNLKFYYFFFRWLFFLSIVRVVWRS